MVDTTATLRPLYVRILFPYILTLPKTDPRRQSAPPSITGSKDIDIELYTYFALIIRDFIHPWYRLVTNDGDFATEIVNVLTLVVQAVQKRCCEEVDWSELVLISIPNLLTLHYRDYRQAKERLGMGHGSGAHSLENLFHGMQPHFALQSDAAHEAEYMRILADSILGILLKDTEFGNDSVRYLSREIFAHIVLASIVESLSDTYTLHMILCKLLAGYDPIVDAMEEANMFFESTPDTQGPGTPPSLPDTSQLQSALKEAQMTDLADDPSTAVSQEKTPDKEEISRQLQRLQEKLQLQGEEALEMDMNEPKDQQQTWQRFSFGYITLQVILAHFKAMWVYLTALFTHSQERYQQLTRHQQLTRRVRLAEPMMRLLHSALLIERTIVIDWVWRNFSMFLWPLMRIFGVGVLVDKFLEQTILYFLSEGHLLYYLRLGRDLLWPNGVFMQRGGAVTAQEREDMRIRAERLLLVSLPPALRETLFETNDMKKLQARMHETLEPIQNKYINKHLMYLLVDLISSRILPELLEEKS